MDSRRNFRIWNDWLTVVISSNLIHTSLFLHISLHRGCLYPQLSPLEWVTGRYHPENSRANDALRRWTLLMISILRKVHTLFDNRHWVKKPSLVLVYRLQLLLLLFHISSYRHHRYRFLYVIVQIVYHILDDLCISVVLWSPHFFECLVLCDPGHIV